MYQLQQPQLGVMNQLKEQLEERTRILQADIKTQQQELHDIKEKLHLANLQVVFPYFQMKRLQRLFIQPRVNLEILTRHRWSFFVLYWQNGQP